MATRPLPGTICTGDALSTPLVRYEFMAPPDLWVLDAIYGMLVNQAFPSRWTECGAATCDAAAQAVSNMIVTLRRSIMIGSVIATATENAPDGTLLCDGATYVGADYPELFAVIASEFKSGANFTVPDLRGRVVMGVGPGFAFSADGGEQEHTLTIPEIPSHAHSIDLFVTSLALAPGELPVQTDVIFNTVTGFEGGDQGHNNLQPFLVLRYYIIAR